MHYSLPVLTNDVQAFPDVSTALTEPNGLLAIGGDLSPQRLLAAYQQGIFPWYDDSSPILWWSPNPRAILWLDQLKISKSLKKTLTQDQFTFKADTAFIDVITACSERTSPDKHIPATWITDELKQGFLALHQQGYAHSIEIYQNNQLAGGLYGVSIGKCFFGESMFFKVPNFSKIALVVLVKQLQLWEFDFIDCQVWSTHLGSLGATEIPRERYLELLKPRLQQPNLLGPWQLSERNKIFP